MSNKELKVGDTKVTLNAGASEKIIAAGQKSVTVTDDLGREITLKKPDALSNLDFQKAIGEGSTGYNVFYASEVGHLRYVSSIDGDAVVTPSSDGEIRALYKRLGEEGNVAAQLAVFKHFTDKEAMKRVQDDIKNS